MRRLPLILLAATIVACAHQGAVATPATAAAPVVVRRLADASDQFITVGDVRLRYRDYGRGEPVVLLHGYAGSMDFLRSLADSLARDYRVIALDERGFGQSTKLADPARFGREMGEDVVRVLDQLHVGRAHLIGHSMGALVAAYVAANHPERVATASLVAGPFFPDSAAIAKSLAPTVADLQSGVGLKNLIHWLDAAMTDSALTATNAQIMSANDLGSLTATAQSMGALALTPLRARSIGVPAAVIVGTSDPLLPQSRAIAAAWPGATLVEVQGASHMSIVASREALAAIRRELRVRTAALGPSAHVDRGHVDQVPAGH